jgi:hypothetical protein
MVGVWIDPLRLLGASTLAANLAASTEGAAP